MSALRIRLGVCLILLWWLPFWMLSPMIADAIGGSNTDHLTATITTVIIVIQTVVGFIGVLVAGQQVKEIRRTHTRKQTAHEIWYMLRHGAMRT